MPEMPSLFVMIGWGVLVLLIAAAVAYAVANFYTARSDRTYMTHNDEGFKRSLKGKGVIWDPEESIVRGPTAPQLSYVAFDSTNGQRKMSPLLDPRTGAINLRPQYCTPLPFIATTGDGHRLTVEARVQFSINRDLLKYVYQLDDFAMALETRIHSAFRSAIGQYQDEDLRASLHEVEKTVIERLRQAERDGDEAGEAGMALGVNFHTASFTYSENYEESVGAGGVVRPVGAIAGAAPGVDGAARQAVRAQGVLALRPQQLDQIADVFKNRDPAATKALLAILDMQTRQNIAEALAASGHLVVMTPSDLGIVGVEAAQRQAAARAADGAAAPPPQAERPNGFGART